MKPLIMKFGGSSLADARRIHGVGDVIASAVPTPTVVVLSATGDTTDLLFEAARLAATGDLEAARALTGRLETFHLGLAAEVASDPSLQGRVMSLVSDCEDLLQGVSLLGELSARSRDAIVSFGERLSTLLCVAHLNDRGLAAEELDARRIIRTNDAFGCAAVDEPEMKRGVAEILGAQLAPARIVVTQGFVGATPTGVTTTLGRGGSDYTAALLGLALEASEVQIWTDVEGVFTSDPRVVPDARPIGELSFGEAGELAAFGAKVLHPATIQPAVRAGIPVTVRHSARPQGRFTTIRSEISTGRSVTAIASRAPITVITVTSSRMLHQAGFLARLFDVFGRRDIDVDLVATAEVSVSLTVGDDAPLADALDELRTFATVEVSPNRGIVAIIGERLKATAGLATLIFTALRDINVEMVSMGANEINLSLVVEEDRLDEAVRSLHGALFDEA